MYDFKTKRIEYQKDIYEPFVYLIRSINLDKYYIGVRVAPGCLLTDLGTKYLTSSKIVKKEWAENADNIEIVSIQVCTSNHEALILEGELIHKYNAVKDEKFFNLHYPGVGFNMSGCKHTEKSLIKMSKSQKKRFEDPQARQKISEGAKLQHATYGSPMQGKHHNEYTLKKMSDARKQYYKEDNLTDEIRDIISKAQKQRFTKYKHPAGFKGKKQKRKTCLHCNKTIAVNMYARYHGDKCKFKDIINAIS